MELLNANLRWSCDFDTNLTPQMQRVFVRVDMLIARHMKLQYGFIVRPKQPLHIIHFLPSRRPRLKRYTDMLPRFTRQFSFRPVASVAGDDFQDRPVVRNMERTSRTVVFGRSIRTFSDSILLNFLRWAFPHLYLLPLVHLRVARALHNDVLPDV